MKEKKIVLEKMRVGDLKHGFGNPRKISKKKEEELERSMEMFGDFGIFLIDEENNVIAGNQRSKILATKNPDILVDVKRLVGYTKSELKAINIKDNTHAGEWDLDLLAEWTADLSVDLGVEIDKDIQERTIPEMELIHYEKYDYVLIACRSVLDYNDLVRKLGIEGKKIKIAKTRRINARAIWYDKMDAEIVPKEEYEKLKEKKNNKKTGEDNG